MKKINFLSNDALRFIILVAVLAGCLYTGKYFSDDFEYYRQLISKIPVYLKGGVFVFLYVGVTFFAWLMKDVFKILGAVLFGAYYSTLFIYISEIINATILFRLSRKLGRGFIEHKLKGKVARFDQKIQTSGFWGIFVLRMTPIMPYRFLDLLVGLTKTSFRNYLVIVLLASPLRIFWIQFILAAIGEQFLQEGDFTKFVPLLNDYLLSNSVVFKWSAAYVIITIILMIWFRKKTGRSANAEKLNPK